MNAPEPVRRSHVVADATPAECYAVVVDFEAYPRLFPEISSTKVLEREGRRVRVETTAKVVLSVRYVLDLVCDPESHTVDWTYVEGEIITGSEGRWRFVADRAGGTRMDYEAAVTIKAPVPGFMLRKITDGLVSLSLPAMFASIAREVAARKPRP